MTEAFVGVDVGTGSARAGVFTREGRALGQHVVPITTPRPRAEHAEQSTDEIWRAVAGAVRTAVSASGAIEVAGIGFDATCSLALIDASGGPVPVNADGENARNVIVWMDHRAGAEAERINQGGFDVLRYVGGRISLEMETPKLVWLAKNLPASFARAAHFFDLPDFLTWRATGATTRSLCSTVCKWTYLGHENRWDPAYFEAIGLGALVAEDFARVGREVLPIGAPVGRGLDTRAAAELGLPVGTPVGTSAIDAHAGGIGTIGAALPGETSDDATLNRRVALVGGTSSCHMAVSDGPRFVPGVWGPYYSAMIPGLWLNEGGQSAVGSLIDHVVQAHAAYAGLKELSSKDGGSIYTTLNARLPALGGTLATRNLHVDPDFHGNRSPRADASLRGTVSGLSLSAGPDELALLYLATIQAIAYGTRHIIETMNATGYAIDTILASGGGTKNPVFLQAHADATGCRVVLPEEPEAVLLGAAILGAVAAGAYADQRAAMTAMTRAGRIIEPDPSTRGFHDAKYAVFEQLHQDQIAYREIMRGAPPHPAGTGGPGPA